MFCARHPEVAAEWECLRCGAWSCEGCLSHLASAVSTQRIPACGSCGGVARRAPRVVLAPIDDDRALVRRPLTGEALLTAFAFAIPAALTDLVPLRAAVLFAIAFTASLSGYYLQTIDHVGRGEEGLPFNSRSVYDRWTIAKALARGFVCVAVGYGPLIVWRCFVPVDEPALDLLFSLIWLAFGLALMPAAVLGVVLGNGALSGAWPLNWARIIRHAPGPYLRLCGVFAATVAVGGAALGIVVAIFGGIPVLGRLAAGMVLALAVMLQATMVGGFLRRHAEELGYS